MKSKLRITYSRRRVILRPLLGGHKTINYFISGRNKINILNECVTQNDCSLHTQIADIWLRFMCRAQPKTATSTKNYIISVIVIVLGVSN